MFYLRKIDKDSKVESNVYLGKTYTYENKDTCKDWEEKLTRVLDCMNEDAKKRAFGFVCDENGRPIPLFHSSDNYIVTENGNTYSRLY